MSHPGPSTRPRAASLAGSTIASEHTPLLTQVHIAPYHRTHRSTTCTRFLFLVFRVILFFSLLFLLVLVPFNLFPKVHLPFTRGILPYPTFPASHSSLKLEKLLRILQETPQPEKAREWSKFYTSGPHLAGKNLSQAIWTKQRWEEHGIKSEIVAYEVYMNYPVSHRLALLDGKDEGKVLFEASLKEDAYKEDPTTRLEDSVMTFHGYSANGNVTAPYIFGAYCTHADYEKLIRLNIPIKDHIVVCRYGAIFRGIKVQRAQELGAVGVVIYTDPGDDSADGWGGGGNGGAGKAYPEGPGRNPSSVQRGSVQFLAQQPGDPTTPGYASHPGVPRTDPHGSTPKIPSLPISWKDAVPLLKALNGSGKKIAGWRGGLEGEGVEYWTGPVGYNEEEVITGIASATTKAPSKVLLHLHNQMTFTTTPIWNVIGVINGTIPGEMVVIGNHRDAWIAGGSGDPNSGSAALIELIRSFGVMIRKGWAPLRTIVIASWDGEEAGLVGSTEWVEDHLSHLKEKCIAYLNVDVAATGSVFSTQASPLLTRVLTDAVKFVQDPYSNSNLNPRSEVGEVSRGKSVYDVWNKYIRNIGSGSDFTAFQDYAGVPSVDFTFKQPLDGAIWHYHSNYDSFHWMDTYGDPTWEYHIAATKILGTMALNLVESQIIPFKIEDYAKFLIFYLDKIEKSFEEATAVAGARDMAVERFQTYNDRAISSAKDSLSKLHTSLSLLLHTAQKFDNATATLAVELAENGDHIKWWKWWTRMGYWLRVRRANQAMMFFERKFLYEKGLDGRGWFKHVGFAPGRWTGYSGDVFPGLVESIEDRNWTGVVKWAGIVGACVGDARESLL